MHKEPGYRRRFFWWILEKKNVPENCILPKWARIIRFLLFPIETTYYTYIDTNNIYDTSRDSFKIFGREYSSSFFRYFSPREASSGSLFELVSTEDSHITIRKYVAPESLDVLMTEMEELILTRKNFEDNTNDKVEFMKRLLVVLDYSYFIIKK